MYSFLIGGTNGNRIRIRSEIFMDHSHACSCTTFTDDSVNVPPTKCIAERQTVPIRFVNINCIT